MNDRLSTSRVAVSSLALLCVAGCATTRQPGGTTAVAHEPPQPTTAYYFGTVQTSSPDGAQPYGPPKPGLVQRVIDPARGTIVETVLDRGALRRTTLTRQAETNVFAATADDASFTGTLTMTGEPWAYTGWTYAISMTDGRGRIEGTGTLDATGLRTEKYFVSADGVRRVRIVDDLRPIERAEYDRRLAELRAAAASAPPEPEHGESVSRSELVLHVDVAVPGQGAPHGESFRLDPGSGVQTWSIDLAPMDRLVTRTSNAAVTMWIERAPGTRVIEGGTEISLVPSARPAALDRACVGDGGPGIAWSGWLLQLQTVCRERRLTVTATPPSR